MKNPPKNLLKEMNNPISLPVYKSVIHAVVVVVVAQQITRKQSLSRMDAVITRPRRKEPFIERY